MTPLRSGEVPNLKNSGSSIVITIETIAKKGIGLTHEKDTLADRKEKSTIPRTYQPLAKFSYSLK